MENKENLTKLDVFSLGQSKPREALNKNYESLDICPNWVYPALRT